MYREAFGNGSLQWDTTTGFERVSRIAMVSWGVFRMSA